MPGSAGLLSRLRRPAYTGANRCWPCTAANLALAALACANVYLWGVALWSGTAGVAAAGAVAACSLAMVWLRGYLLPGTPALAERLPAAVLGVFGKDATPTVPRGVTGRATETNGGVTDEAVAPVDRLRADGVLDVDGAPTPAVRAARDERVAGDPRDDALLVERFGLPAGTAVDGVGRGVVARADDERVGAWPSALALRTDVASAGVLAEHTDWATLTTAERGRLCATLRERTERCPGCGGSLTTGTATVRSCCGRLDVVATECVDCGTRLTERPADRVTE